MSKTFTYVLLVILVYLFIVFPKTVGRSGSEVEEENNNGVIKRSTSISAGYVS